MSPWAEGRMNGTSMVWGVQIIDGSGRGGGGDGGWGFPFRIDGPWVCNEGYVCGRVCRFRADRKG